MSDNGFNPYIVLVVGKSGTGKSSSLKGLDNPDKVLYLNCENGRALPFKSKFKEVTITNPNQVPSYIEKATASDKFDTIVIDRRSAWGDYAQFFKNIMHLVAHSNKQFIFLAHTTTQYNESNMAFEAYVPVKGSLNNNGIESYFSNVIAVKKMSTNDLEEYNSTLLNITEDEEDLGFKHTLQTRLTKETVNERIKSPQGMFTKQETYIDGNIQLILNRLREYYA